VKHGHATDPRRTLGADPRRFTVDAEDRARLEMLAARTGGIVETEPTATGLTVRHIAATGRTVEVSAPTVPDAVRAITAAVTEAVR
jgi:hypothetical protein